MAHKRVLAYEGPRALESRSQHIYMRIDIACTDGEALGRKAGAKNSSGGGAMQHTGPT